MEHTEVIAFDTSSIDIHQFSLPPTTVTCFYCLVEDKTKAFLIRSVDSDTPSKIPDGLTPALHLLVPVPIDTLPTDAPVLAIGRQFIAQKPGFVGVYETKAKPALKEFTGFEVASGWAIDRQETTKAPDGIEVPTNEWVSFSGWKSVEQHGVEWRQSAQWDEYRSLADWIVGYEVHYLRLVPFVRIGC